MMNIDYTKYTVLVKALATGFTLQTPIGKMNVSRLMTLPLDDDGNDIVSIDGLYSELAPTETRKSLSQKRQNDDSMAADVLEAICKLRHEVIAYQNEETDKQQAAAKAKKVLAKRKDKEFDELSEEELLKIAAGA